MFGAAFLDDALAKRGYTHAKAAHWDRAPWGQFPRRIIRASTGRTVAVLTAHKAWEWLARRERKLEALRRRHWFG